MAASSSTKKAAKLAGRSSGRSVQFQGGSVFPIALLLVVVLGVASIVYARQTIPGAGDGAPVTPISEYYDVAYGINICGDWATINDGDGSVNADGRIDYPAYRDTGVYQYADGVATVHPYAAELADVPLDLSALFAVHGITIADDSLTFPEDQMDGKVYTEGETTCNIDGVETNADVSVIVWESADDTSSGNRYISKMGEIPLDSDGLVIAVAFVPRGDPVAQPASVGVLRSLSETATAADAEDSTDATVAE
ncbi:MAG: hypothetical protein ACPHES_10040 [Ilumatobacteraceae bacterium]